MSGPPTSGKIARAEREIARILARLEEETGSLVRSLVVSDIDVTTMSDSHRRYRTRVGIEIERQPGRDWDTGA